MRSSLRRVHRLIAPRRVEPSLVCAAPPARTWRKRVSTRYADYGRHESRDPSRGFDTTAYLANNPDVATAGVNPLAHFLYAVLHEARSPLETACGVMAGVD
jgi:hypothetical protein